MFLVGLCKLETRGTVRASYLTEADFKYFAHVVITSQNVCRVALNFFWPQHVADMYLLKRA
jgi:hypothetical protein